MSSEEDFISQVCNAFLTVNKKISGVALEGWEREYRRGLAQHLFDEVLGWRGYSRVGEIYDIVCLDDEGFSIIIVETKGPGIELTHEIKEKLRRRIEELGSVKYGVFANPSRFIIFEYIPYELKEVANVNTASAIGVAEGLFGLSEAEKRQILKLEMLKRERLVWIEDPTYFERTYKEVSVAKGEGVKLLTDNLKSVVKDLTGIIMNFFDSYWKRSDYSGRFLQNVFNDWLKMSMRDEEFRKGDEKKRREIIDVFCRETAYVLVGRMLFIRICEDKGISETTISGKGLAESLRYYGKRRIENVYLRLFYESREEIKKYYSHLHELGYFDWWWISPDKIELLTRDDRRIQDRLDEDLNYQIKKCLRRLNRFDFTEVNRDILGDVYQGYLPPDERKRLGEFYTPKEVVEYILDAVGYKPENEVRGKKILDPACGSGSFLVEATQRLIEGYRRIGFNLKNPDDAKQIIDGCVNSIYGLDIHPFACFIAEMNLLFQLVDLYDAVRQKDRYYELPRLNIYRTDSLAPSEEPIKLAEFLDNSRRIMLIEETRGADKVKNTKFDYVVGNPPYVRIHKLTEDQKRAYETEYKSARGLYDLYILFIERGIRWLEDGGKFGYICSDQFMIRSYGKALRGLILNNYRILQIIDFKDSGVFKEVTNYPSIIIIEKNDPKDNFVRCAVISKPMDNILEDISKYIIEESFSCESYDFFRYPQNELSDKIWVLTPISERKLIHLCEEKADCRLGELTDRKIAVGVQTGADEIFMVKKNAVSKFTLERELLKKFLASADVRKWKIKWSENYLIYPYMEQNGKTKLMNEGIFWQKYPNVYGYLQKFKEKLTKRWGIKIWYELPTSRSIELFNVPKILTPTITDKNNFAYDDEGYFFSKGGKGHYGIILKKESRDEHTYFYLLGLLNSKLFEFYIKHFVPIKSGKWYEYMTQYLERLPIKLITEQNEATTNQIIQNVGQIIKINKEVDITGIKVKQFPNSYFENEWAFDKLANVIRAQSLSRESYAISEKSLRTDYLLRDLDGKETFRIILAPNEYVDFYSDEVASYVFEVLKTMNRITKREFLELKIPSQPHLKRLMNQYRKDKEQIVENEKAVKELEKQIDDLVYKLYDITYPERRIIEEYLAKF